MSLRLNGRDMTNAEVAAEHEAWVKEHRSTPFSGQYGTTPGGIAYLANNADSYVNAINQQALWDREDKLRADAEKREDYSYDRLFEAARRNGVNPALLIDSISPQVGSAASYSTSAAKTSNYEANAKTEQANAAKIVGALIAAIAMIAAAA